MNQENSIHIDLYFERKVLTKEIGCLRSTLNRTSDIDNFESESCKTSLAHKKLFGQKDTKHNLIVKILSLKYKSNRLSRELFTHAQLPNTYVQSTTRPKRIIWIH